MLSMSNCHYVKSLDDGVQTSENAYMVYENITVPEDLENVKTKLTERRYSSNYGSFSSFDSMDPQEHLHVIKGVIDVPQGRHLGIFSTMILFISRILGSGIFAVPSGMIGNTGGNIVLYFTIWGVTSIMAFAGLYLFLEFGSRIPKSGGRKNFLEQTYTKPNLMMTVTYGAYSILSGLALSSAIVFGKYFLSSLGYQDVDSTMQSKIPKYLSVLVVILAVVVHGFSVHYGILVQNILGSLKLLLAFLMCSTGIYTLYFYEPPSSDIGNVIWDLPLTYIDDQQVVSISSIANAFISALFCFAGWDSVHTVASEIKNPARTLKISGPLSLLVCLICYTLMNVAYLKVLTLEEIQKAGPLIGSVLFTKLFGVHLGSRVLSMSIALSALSNILVVTYSMSRMNQEIFREGFLPFSKVMARNYPRNAPLPALLVCGILTIGWIIILPSESASFDYLIEMEGYGNQFFLFLTAIGLFIYKSRNNSDQPEIRASSVGVGAIAMLSLYLLISPFMDRSGVKAIQFLPEYQITALFTIFACFIFWLIKFVCLPKMGGYILKSKLVALEDGLIVTEWRKKYK